MSAVMEHGSPAYMRLHYEVKRDRGPASSYPCAEDCGRQAAEWSNVSGEYLGPDDFRPLCRSCHRSIDLRRAHDRREDHEWQPSPNPGESQRCWECRKRSRRAEHQRVRADAAKLEARRASNRAAVKRYREARR